MSRRPRAIPGRVAPPDHRTDRPCDCSLCRELAEAMELRDGLAPPNRIYPLEKR